MFDPNRNADDGVINSERAAALREERRKWTERCSIAFDTSGAFARFMQDAPDELFIDRIEKITGEPLLLTAVEKDAHAVKCLNHALALVHELRASVGWRKITVPEAEESRAYKTLRSAVDREAWKYVLECQLDPPGKLDKNGKPVTNGLYDIERRVR